MGLIDFFDGDLADEPAIDIDLEGLYDICIMTVAE
jgi:hypothetical protein